jgi:hypothetical protein
MAAISGPLYPLRQAGSRNLQQHRASWDHLKFEAAAALAKGLVGMDAPAAADCTAGTVIGTGAAADAVRRGLKNCRMIQLVGHTASLKMGT